MNTEKIKSLLYDCLSQFEALNNACTFTRSQNLRDRLREALGLPAEMTYCNWCSAPLGAGVVCPCEETVMPTEEALQSNGCDDSVCSEFAHSYQEDYEPSPYDGTYSED